MSDFLIIENGDGGEIDISASGDIVLDGTFYSAIYLTLFGGKSFYSQFDVETSDNESIEIELNKPSNVDNLKNLANIINFKLNWLIDFGLAENIDTDVIADGDVLLKINITIKQPDGNLEKYGIIWDKEKSELKHFGEIYGRV